MKKIIYFVLIFISLFFTVNTQGVSAQSDNPITVTRQFQVSAQKNNNADETKDYTVTVTGTIKNNTTESISNVKIYLEVSTAYLGLKGNLEITINEEILPNQTYNINLTTDTAEKYAKVDKVSATVDGGSIFVLFPTAKPQSGSNGGLDLDVEAPSIGLSLGLIAIFAALYGIAIYRYKKKN